MNSVTVELRPFEEAALMLMSLELDMTPEKIMLAALREYQMMHVMRQRGVRYALVNSNGNEIVQPVYGCPALD